MIYRNAMSKAYIFTGFPCSGKSTALKTAYEAELHTVEMSDVVRRQYREETGQEEADDNAIGNWATVQRMAISFGYFAECASELINNRIDDNSSVAISGVRSIEEVEVFRTALEEEVTVIGIRTPKEVRWKWAFEERDVRPTEMRQRDQRENEWGLDKLLNRHTDMIIRNGNVTQERFEQKIQEVVTE